MKTVRGARYKVHGARYTVPGGWGWYDDQEEILSFLYDFLSIFLKE